MIKYICDICLKEIEDVNSHGEFKMSEKAFEFIKHQKADRIRHQVFLMCVKCAGEVRSRILELQKAH